MRARVLATVVCLSVAASALPAATGAAADTSAAPTTVTGTQQATVRPIAATVPKPGYGKARAQSYPYSASVPRFPTSIPGWKVYRKGRTVTRLFAWEGWSTIPGLDRLAANDCSAYLWQVRWRSANRDVTVRSGAGIVPLSYGPVVKARAGGAGWIAGSSCYAPLLRFGRAINGNQSNLVDVYVEYRYYKKRSYV